MVEKEKMANTSATSNMKDDDIPTEVPENYKRIWIEVMPGMDVSELEMRLEKGMKRETPIELHQPMPSVRGFGFIELDDDIQGKHMVEVFNNTKWKGFRLKMAPSKPDYKKRLELEKYEMENPPKKVKKLEWWEEEGYSGYENTEEIVEVNDVIADENCVAESAVIAQDIENATAVSSDDYESDNEEQDEEEKKEEEDDEGEEMDNNDDKEDVEAHEAKVIEESMGYSDSDDSLDRTKVGRDKVNVINEFADGIPSDESDQEGDCDMEVVEHGDEHGHDTTSQELALKSEMMSEANKSLALLSSFVSSTLPPEEQGEEIKVKEIKPKVSNGFMAVNRFWGDESTEPEVSDVVDVQEEEVISESVSHKTEAKLTELKSVFQGHSNMAPPKTGFAESEDPLTLSGFASISEREPAKQSHTFGFSFDVPSSTSQPEVSLPVTEIPQPAPVPVQRSDPEFTIWNKNKGIKAAALLFLKDSAKDNHENNQNVLRDVKRKLRVLRA